MATHLETLRRIRLTAEDNVPRRTVDPDLAREAGMDGNYARLLQAARDLDDVADATAADDDDDDDDGWVTFFTEGGGCFQYRLGEDGDPDAPFGNLHAGDVVARLRLCNHLPRYVGSTDLRLVHRYDANPSPTE